MDGLIFFRKLLIILGFSIPVIYLFNKLKFPSIIGFLITGIIIGPFGLGLLTDTAGIQLMAEMGVITPPIGINAYVVAGVARDVPLHVIFKGTLRMLYALIALAVLLMIFPQIPLFLPNLIK